MKSVYSAVRTGSLNKAVCASSLKVFKLKSCTVFLFSRQFRLRSVRPATNFGLFGIQIKYSSTETTPAVLQRRELSSASSTIGFSDGCKATEEGLTPDYWSNTVSVMLEQAVSLAQRGLRIYLQARRVHVIVYSSFNTYLLTLWSRVLVGKLTSKLCS